MRIIDLMNKVVNGEEVPEKVKYDGDEYTYNSACFDFLSKKEFYLFQQVAEYYNSKYFLEKEIEIIEEKEIEELNLNHEYYLPSKELVEDYEFKKFVLDELFAQYDKINELVKVVNGLKKTGEIK